MTQHKIFTALPEFLSNHAKELLFASDIDESTGRISWPRVVVYEYINEWKEKLKSPIPPPPKEGSSYLLHILNIEAWEYLCKTGWAYDSRHTGRTYQVIDNRKAPGA